MEMESIQEKCCCQMKCNDQSTLKMAVVSVDGCTYERNAHFCHYADIFIIIIYILQWFDDI